MKVIPSVFPAEIIVNEASSKKLIVVIKNIQDIKYEIEEDIDKIKIILQKED